MAPMGWSVVSAVTVAMLMAVIQWVATAAATPAGQVSIAFRKKQSEQTDSRGRNNFWNLNEI